jgi:ABC-type transport system substrate-binding protein
VDQYRADKAHHISGVSVQGKKLVIRLHRPAPNFLWLAAQSCAVPRGTPVVREGLETPVASAGPYYLAEHTDSFAVLRRNPNYGGRRPQHLDAIVFKFNVAPGEAASQIENDSLDYFLESQSPTLTPNTAAARAAGARYRVRPSSSAGVQFFAFNVQRPLFSDIRMRRAVQFALNRVALAGASAGVGIPATRLLSPGVLGYDGRPLYPPHGDVARAQRLVGGRRSRAVVYTWVDPPYTDAFNRLLRQELAAIGTRMSLIRIDQTKGFELSKARRADLIWGGLSANSPDAAAYLKPLSHLPPAYSNEIARIQLLSPLRANVQPSRSYDGSRVSPFSPSTSRTRCRSSCHVAWAASSTIRSTPVSISPRSASVTTRADEQQRERERRAFDPPSTPHRDQVVARVRGSRARARPTRRL